VKKVIVLFAIAAMVLGFAGCSKNKSSVDNANSGTLKQGGTAVPAPPVPAEPTRPAQ